ncbi:MAG TPA: ATP-binding protein [Longimicrobiaceae bacterium]|nr:ATP-binding protein [Longimicrobiaceae bacterium]
MLFNLAFLAIAALVLGLWTASVIRLTSVEYPRSLGILVVLVLLDLLIFLALGNYLVDRLVLRPLSGIAAVAESIADGEYDRRAEEVGNVEMRALSASLNRLTNQLLQNQERLADNVSSLDETNRLLTETQRELVQSEKLASIGRLAAGVAHEIGNPLGAIIGYAEVLRRRGESGEMVDGINLEARRIDRIVRGLLDYARPGSLSAESVDVNDAVNRVVALLRDQGRLTNVTLKCELGSDLPPIHAVPHRIDQIFVNLITNAEAAMGQAGEIRIVTLREEYLPEGRFVPRRADDPPGVDYSHLRRIRHASFRDANRLESGDEVVRVIFADTGPGIPAENIGSVFDPFFTTKPPGEGTGLGLAIVASAVAELGGRIDLSSAEGGGATFNLLFPIRKVDA